MLRTTLLALVALLHASTAAAVMPAQLEAGAKRAGIPPDGIESVESQPVAWTYERESGARQVTVFALMKVAAPAKAILKDLKSRNGVLQSEAMRQVGVFGSPPGPVDVAKYRLPDSDLEALSDCELEDCKFKLSAQGVKNLDKIDWDAPDARNRVDTLAREGLVNFVRRYQERGHEALFVYADKEEPQDQAEGIEKLLGQWGKSTSNWATLRAHLNDYPNNSLDGAQDRFLWTVRDYGYRPVTGIIHAVVYEPPDGPVAGAIVLKNLYSSHYFLARLQLIGLYPDAQDPGATYVAYIDRLLFDDDVGRMKRLMIESGVLKDVRQRLELFRKGLE